MNKLSAHSLIRITAVANVLTTEQLWNQDDDFVVEKPQLSITVSVTAKNRSVRGKVETETADRVVNEKFIFSSTRRAKTVYD
jgi:hypothetical protein